MLCHETARLRAARPVHGGRGAQSSAPRHQADPRQARLLPGRRVEVVKGGGERLVLEADVVLLASGSRPRHPPWYSHGRPDVHDSETILGIEGAPESILVIGRGSFGCECASIFAGLGVQVTVVEAGSHLPPALDVEMARVLAESFNSMGIRVIPMVSVSGVVREGNALAAMLSNRRTLRAKKILIAVSRCPQIEGLGLAEAGIEIDSAGWVQVDDRYATTAPGVFAAGDVIGPLGVASTAMEQARVAVCHAFGFEYKKETDRLDRPTSSPSLRQPGSASRRNRSAHQGPSMRLGGLPSART
jgi:NAD(P) transhydrogenase